MIVSWLFDLDCFLGFLIWVLGGFFSALPENCLCILARCIYFITILCLNCSNVKIYEKHIFYRKLYIKKSRNM